ncbi:cytochrome c [Leptospira stimsonii]|uniref:Cytochrome C n=1 Tax=Leptospira stimsonii TaxID=2202203 RepID=A0A4R9L285_9LEPT|nr:c-type cytochrome [Leptospira stimsonii]RHX88247.1 cytochrome C [Leptospira stimsonii]TGK26385.1 cytochrome C [Leptospira stimsonii]TGM10716.1 cytochrome C [Leptospira stimsonii]
MMNFFGNLLSRIFLTIILVIIGGLGFLYIKYPAIGKKEEIKIAHTPEQVRRGEYLVNNVAACMGCHTGERDPQKLFYPFDKSIGAGNLKFGEEMGLPGTFYSRNITPALTGLKNWSDTDIFYAITSGVSKDGSPLFPLMPYENYAQLDKEDIYAIIAYIRTIPAVENHVEKSKANFPMNLIMRTIPKPPEFSQRPNPKDTIAYGKYMFTLAACNDCHTQKIKGKPIEGMELAGGFEFALATGGKVRSSNISPDIQTGIGTWTRENFIARFKASVARAKANPDIKPGEFNSLMPWLEYAGMNDQDLGAIYAFLMSSKPVSNKVQTFEK